jgi:DNA ligase-1
MLHPPYVGTQFNFAEKSLIPVLALLLDCSQESVKDSAKKWGDLGSVLVREDWRGKGDLSIKDVYKMLCDIEKISGTGSQEEKASVLKQLLEQLDAVSAKYVVRIVVGKLRLGFSDMTIVDALSWMQVGDKSLRGVIEDAYNIRADIGLIAHVLKQEGVDALKKMHAQVGIPIRPAAAERLPTPEQIIEKIGVCVAQPKLDGFRLQIHIDKTHKQPRIHFFSRHLQDMSDMFPDLVLACQKLNVESMICEGEAIVYDPNTGGFLPFQETVKRKRKHGVEQAAQEMPLRVFLFDLLYLNGKDVLDLPHSARRKKLLSIVHESGDVPVQVIEEKNIVSVHDLQNYFAQEVASGLEGLVIKKPDALYQPGKRNFNWIKLKRRQQGHLEDTIDCVILGYYAGSGKRAHFGIGAFLVGVYNKKEDVFETIAKIGTGLSDEAWKALRKKCDDLAIAREPHNVVVPKELKPDVWVEPEIVCSVLADEITLSPVHTAAKTEKNLGFALRFPRITGYRPDKGPSEATTTSEVSRLYEDQAIKQERDTDTADQA